MVKLGLWGAVKSALLKRDIKILPRASGQRRAKELTMKNTFEAAIKFTKSSAFEFIALDEEQNEILYIRCESEYEEIYKKSIEFAERFICAGCDSLAVKDLVHFGEYNKYAIACQIIAAVAEAYI